MAVRAAVRVSWKGRSVGPRFKATERTCTWGSRHRRVVPVEHDLGAGSATFPFQWLRSARAKQDASVQLGARCADPTSLPPDRGEGQAHLQPRRSGRGRNEARSRVTCANELSVGAATRHASENPPRRGAIENAESRKPNGERRKRARPAVARATATATALR